MLYEFKDYIINKGRIVYLKGKLVDIEILSHIVKFKIIFQYNNIRKI